MFSEDLAHNEKILAMNPIDFGDPSAMSNEELHQTIRTLLREASDRETLTPSKVSIMDQVIPEFKRTAVYVKPSRVVFAGPSNMAYNFFRCIPKVSFRSTHQLLKEERAAWKARHHEYRYALKVVDDPSDNEETMVQLVESLLLPNVPAIQERLAYFRSSLNDLLYGSFIPMDMVFSVFLKYFPNGTEKFAQPPKQFYYADISLISGVVLLVVIFTRYNAADSSFKYKLSCTTAQLTMLALQTLNFSEFRRKRITYQALLSLIVIKGALFSYDNSVTSNEENDSYPFFQLSLDMCYQMGVHRTLDCCFNKLSFRDYDLFERLLRPDKLKLKELWNYIKIQDIVYSSELGTPLLVNDEFCDGFCPFPEANSTKTLISGFLLLRGACTILNSKKGICLRSLLSLLDELFSYCKILRFSMFTAPSSDYSIFQMAHLFKLKLQLLLMSQTICQLGTYAVAERLNSQVSQDDRSTLERVNKKLFQGVQICNRVSLQHIGLVSDGKTIFGSEADGTYMIFFRDVFSRVIRQAMTLWFLMIFTEVLPSMDVSKRQESALLGLETPDPDIDELENTLYNDCGSDAADCMAKRIMTYSKMVSFVGPFYNSIAKNQSIRDSLDSFMMLRMTVVFAFSLESLEDHFDPSKPNEVDFTQIAAETAAKLQSFNKGVANEQIELATKADQLEMLFQSIFCEEAGDLSSLFTIDARTEADEQFLKFPF